MPLTLENSTAYLRGDFIPFKDANLSIASSSILYGLSVYTVCNVLWNEKENQLNIFRLKDHYDRLCKSGKIMGFSDFQNLFTYESFEKMIIELLKKNSIKQNVLVRIAFFIDANAAGTKIKGLPIACSAYVLPMNNFYQKDGISACISSWLRVADNMIPPRAKVNGSYANQCLMKNEAMEKGFDEAIALNSQGYISEVTVANIFIVKDGNIITPDTDSDILEGITRDTVRHIAKKLNINFIEKKVSKEELLSADEVFISGSSAKIVPIYTIDKTEINNSKIGNMTKTILENYEVIRSGNDKDFERWLTKVY